MVFVPLDIDSESQNDLSGPQKVANILKKYPNRDISDTELHDRQADLDEALKLFTSVSNVLAEITPTLNTALANIDRLRQICERKPILKAAMVSRRLAIQPVIQDIRNISSRVSAVTKIIGKTVHSKKSELEDIIRDPELLR